MPSGRPSPLSALQQADQRLFERVHRAPVVGGRALPRLSHAADHGVLWIGVAALLAAVGGRRGRRAAGRGLGSLSLSSALVNLPFKGLTRRPRPSLPALDPARALRRAPRTTSFPSGHAASAAAFCVGASLEMPALAVPLGAAAGAVAFSRVYTGVHYPGDVAVGAACGAGAALLVRRLWPVTPDVRDRRALTPADDAAPGVSPTGAGLLVAVNPASGPAYRRSPAEELRRRLPDATVVELREDDDVAAVLRRRAPGARALGMAGGDGSVNAAAAVAAELDLPLLAAPAGTLNHLATDLGLESVADCAEAVREGALAWVDVAEVDGRPFLNTASLGAYVEMVDERERLQGRIGKWPATTVAAVRVLRRSRPVVVEIDGNPRRLWLLFCGNCGYGGGVLPAGRVRLDDGVLDVRWAGAEAPLSRLRLVAAMLSGRPEWWRVYRRRECRELRVRSLQGELRLAADGETFDGSAAPRLHKRERRLRMYASPRALRRVER